LKNIIVLILVSLFCSSICTYAQFDLFNKVKKKVEKKIGEAVDKGSEGSDKEAKKPANQDKKAADKTNTEKSEQKGSENNNSSQPAASTDKKESLKSYSKYDFIPGEKVIAFEDFSQDAVGDFPAAWYTNGSAEVVTLNNYPGHWLMFRENSKYVYRLENSLPENYTIEFDFIRNACQVNKSWSIFYLASMDKSQNPYNQRFPGMEFHILHDQTLRIMNRGVDKFEEVDNRKEYSLLKTDCGKPFKVSINIQKRRARIYVNEEKIYDIPNFMPKDKSINTFIIEQPVGRNDKTDFFSNLRIAAGAPDMRNKLLTEGKLVTHGILFDVNSDKIKPESYGTLKEIAAVLQENSDLKVKIVGHTDSDGSDAANLELSKKRSVSVKNTLVSEFGITETRMTTDGKGESEPLGDNNTQAGKANNRRVEFIKTN
jgi:outer membrane protein OmpA-like peptidoglycan-associated protein